MPLPFTYTELLEACPPMLHASHGTMGVIDSHANVWSPTAYPAGWMALAQAAGLA